MIWVDDIIASNNEEDVELLMDSFDFKIIPDDNFTFLGIEIQKDVKTLKLSQKRFKISQKTFFKFAETFSNGKFKIS